MPPRLLYLICAATLFAQAPEQPAGIVLNAGGGSLLRAGTELALAAKTGDILFTGDTLRAEKGTIRFSFCPDKSTQTLPAGAEATIEATQVRVRAGAIADKGPTPFCALPMLPRSIEASQFHNGASTTRDIRQTPLEGTFATRAQALPEAQRAAMMKELEAVDPAIAANPKDPMPRLARAAILDKYRLAADAADEYRRAYELWPDATWMRTRLFVLDDSSEKAAARASAPAAPAGPRKTYALLVGVSKYTNKDIRPLNFAHEDALLFEKYLKSERGGGVPDSNLVLLINEQATTSAIRNSFETLKARATRNDNVLMLFATHGTVVTGKQSGAYIVSFDSDPENLADTAVSMKEVQKLIQEDLGGAGQVLAFVDVCHAGTIGTIPLSNNKRINTIVDRLAETEGESELFLFLASRPNETSEEGPQYGGGHGAFSFFLMEALNGPGDIDRNGDVTIDELIEYTQTKVFEATFERQRPREAGKYTGSRSLANTKQSGIAMLKYTPVPPGGTRGSGTLALTATEASETRSLARPPIPRVRISSALKESVDFEEALTAGRILAGSERNALTGLRQLRGKVPVEELQAQKTRLQVTLEDRGQQVVLRYLTGEQTPQSRNDFITGAAYFATARQITPESLFLEARETFCLGRASLFDRDYVRGQDLLERAIRLDPEGAYTYNALGIAYLEQAIYDRAAQAFREATRRAPYWAYPRHNLSLTLTQIGDYQGAVRGYQEAMRLAPSYSYLPYNLGLVYQRINRRREADAEFRRAIELNPNDGMPYNALGYLNASTGRTADAERFYKQALEKDANLTVARHNLGALYAERMRKPAEAIEVWRQILAQTPGYLPSRLSLAKTLAFMNRTAEAIAEYDVVLKARPEYAAARLAQAELQIKSGARDAAVGNLREVARQQPANAQVWEQIGDVEKAAGRAAESNEAYKKALAIAVEGSARKRIQRKMR